MIEKKVKSGKATQFEQQMYDTYQEKKKEGKVDRLGTLRPEPKSLKTSGDDETGSDDIESSREGNYGVDYY